MDDDALFRALADASRRRLQAKNGQMLGELCRGLAMTRQAVAKHLALLEEANLVSWRRRGREKTALHQPSPDQRDRRTMDCQVRAPAPRGAVGAQEKNWKEKTYD